MSFRRLGDGAAALAAVLLLIAPALWNRYPLLQYDTGGYLARWFEGYLVPSRSTVYGLFLVSGAPFDFWPTVLLQAIVTVWVIRLALRVHGLGRRPLLLLTLVAGLCVGTSLPWLASILLTDIFAGLAVLAAHVFVFHRERTTRIERTGLFIFIAFAAATHSATLAVVLGLFVTGWILSYWRRDISRRATVQGVASVACGAGLLLAANAALSGSLAWTPGGYGILFGRMLQDGIVARYLNEHCPASHLKLCPYRAELPQDADMFLWSDGVFNKLGRFAGLSEEMRTIVIGSIAAYPVTQIETMAVATFRQFSRFSSGEGVHNQLAHTYGIMERYTPSLLSTMRKARQQHGEIDFTLLNRIHVPVGWLSMLLLCFFVVAYRKRHGTGADTHHDMADLQRLAVASLLALVINAAVCGGLSNPHPRYGARIVWIVPFAAALFALRLAARRQDETGPQSETAAALSDADALARG